MSTRLRRSRNDALNPNEVEQLMLGCNDLIAKRHYRMIRGNVWEKGGMR